MRRSTRWPFAPYKGKWQGTFSELQAMETFKKKVVQEHSPTANIISVMTHCFRSYGSRPNLAAYSFVINHLLRKNLFGLVPPILDHLDKSATFQVPEQFFVNLILRYGKADMLQDALSVFLSIPKFRCTPSARSLNSLLSFMCARRENFPLVRDLLLKTPELNIRLEASTFHILIRALCRTGRVNSAVQLLNLMHELLECVPDKRLYSLVLCALCKHSTSIEAMSFLEAMRNAGLPPGTLQYKSVINALVREGRPNDAYAVLARMKLDGRKPDVISYTAVLNGFVLAGDFSMAEELFDEMLVVGIAPDVITYNAYINGLCKQRELGRACRMVFCMERAGCEPDTETFNLLMEGYAKAGEIDEAREVMNEMLEKRNLLCDSRTYMVLVDGLLIQGKMVEACQMLMEMLKKGLTPLPATCNALLRSLCRENLLSEAIQVLEEMIGSSVAPSDERVWEAMLCALRLHVREIGVLLEERTCILDDEKTSEQYDEKT